MYDVLCLGITCCDLTFAGLNVLPELGKEYACKEFYIKPGGAANTPVALTKLGVKTLYASIIGKDHLGNIIFTYLQNTGLDMSAVLHSDEYHTNVTAVFPIGDERAFASYFPEYDNRILIESLKKNIPFCRHVHAYVDDCINIPIIDIVKENNKSLSVDMGFNEKIRIIDIENVLRNCEIFFANEMEANGLTEKTDVYEALEEIMKYAKTAVIKRGSKGSIMMTGGELYKIPPIEKVCVKDTTGAGDLYSAGFIYGIIKGWDMHKSALFASASSTLGVTFYGGMDEEYKLENILQVSSYLRKF